MQQQELFIIQVSLIFKIQVITNNNTDNRQIKECLLSVFM